LTREALPRPWSRDTLDLNAVAIDVTRFPTGGETVVESAHSRISEYGFVLLRRLASWADHEKDAEEFSTFCSHFGLLRAQDGKNEFWRFVRDRSRKTGVSGTSGSTGSMEIELHTENARPPHPPTYIALLCLQEAQTGGASLLASGPEVFDRLAGESRDHVRALQQPMAFGRRKEDFDGSVEYDLQSVFAAGDGFRFRYSRYWIDLAARQSHVALSEDQIRAVEAVDTILAAPTLAVEFVLGRGDAVIVDNRVVMHGRRAFTDSPDAPRTLVRVWIDDPR
jgi:alpha-ketoglutarate-dependent taurine dioxygenase